MKLAIRERKQVRFVSSLELFFRSGGGGWEEKLRIMLNSAKVQLTLPVGAELGNIAFFRLFILHCTHQTEGSHTLNFGIYFW